MTLDEICAMTLDEVCAGQYTDITILPDVTLPNVAANVVAIPLSPIVGITPSSISVISVICKHNGIVVALTQQSSTGITGWNIDSTSTPTLLTVTYATSPVVADGDTFDVQLTCTLSNGTTVSRWWHTGVGSSGGGSGETVDSLGYTNADRLAYMLSNIDWPFAVKATTISNEDTYVCIDFIASTKQPIYYANKTLFTSSSPYYLQFCTRSGSIYINEWVFSTAKSTASDSDVMAYKSDTVLTSPIGGFTIVSSLAALTTTSVNTATGQAPAVAYTITVETTAPSVPIPSVLTWLTLDAIGSQVVAGPFPTNSSGQVVFEIPPGTYYVWRQLSGYNFTNLQTITATYNV